MNTYLIINLSTSFENHQEGLDEPQCCNKSTATPEDTNFTLSTWGFIQT